jgi:hypothetical protein
MNDFWTNCGFKLLKRGGDGRLVVTDDYLRAYFMRPELAPVPQSCDAERALHDALMADPRRAVTDADIAVIADKDAQENYRVMLRFRQQLLAAPTLEAFYSDLFRRDIAVPPDFVHHTVQVILRGILDGSRDALEARAAELLFRKQRVSVSEGAIRLADDETVEMHAVGAAGAASASSFGRRSRSAWWSSTCSTKRTATSTGGATSASIPSSTSISGGRGRLRCAACSNAGSRISTAPR